MIVAARFLRDRRRGFVGWLLGVLAMVLLSVAFYPTIRGDAGFDELVREMPEAMRAMFGMDEAVGLTTAPGFLHSRLFAAILPAMLLVFAIGVGGRALAGSEDDGTLELLLANPIARSRAAWERIGAALLLVVALGTSATVSILVLALPFDALEGVDVAGLVAAGTGMTALAVLHAALALAVGAAVGGRGRAVAVATVVAVAGYLVHGLFGLAEALEPLRALSPWYWSLQRNMLAEGPVWWATALPVAIAAALLAAAVPLFVRRDLR